MKPQISAIALVLLLSIMSMQVQSQVPAIMSYQGTLTNNVGVPVTDGNYNITFRIYELDEGGAPIWTETHLLAVVGGVFGVVLGNVTPLDLPFDKTYYLGVSIDGGAELAPRRKLTAAAYSLNARAIDDGVAVKSLNGLKDDVAIVGGTNVTITQLGNTLTITASGDGGGVPADANTLDQAYDQGGAGAGREIIADAGAVHISGSGGLAVDGRIGVGVTDPEVPVEALSADVYALYGETSTGEQAGAGVFGALNNPNANLGASGVIGVALDQNATSNGVWGDHATVGIGVFGTAPDGFGVAGLGYGAQSENVGVYGESAAYGVGWAGYFYGDLAVVGQVYTGSSAMLIDHPLTPEHKYLYHASVQSPDMMNVYNGNVVLGEDGTAVVGMPEYFEALNRDYRYQLTAVGAPGPNLHIAQEISSNRFRIAGGTPGMKVSWTVTGIRHDPQAEQMDRSVERDKPAEKLGLFFNPAAYGKGRDKSTIHAVHQSLLNGMRAGIKNTSKAIKKE